MSIDHFKIEHQSDPNIAVSGFTAPVPLFCLASVHDPEVKYQWVSLRDHNETFPSSPVNYVRKPGLYSCQVHYCGEIADSKIITVELDGHGMCIYICDRI